MNEVLETIELDGIKDMLVGRPGVSGLSTEQRKRLTIAVELVSNPSIIFMDEPTTGLDARAAAIVMRAVKNVVDTGRTIVCTIHQPSIDIFESFDEVKIFQMLFLYRTIHFLRQLLLGITTLHNGLILSTLSISSHSFALGFSERPHTNGDVSFTYKLIIIL